MSTKTRTTPSQSLPLPAPGLLSAAEVMERYGLPKNRLDYLRIVKRILPATLARDARTGRGAYYFAPEEVETAIRYFNDNKGRRSEPRPDLPPCPCPCSGPEAVTSAASPPAILRAVQAGKAEHGHGFFLVVRKLTREWRAAPRNMPLVLGERRVAEYLRTGRSYPEWEVVPCPLTGPQSRELVAKLNKLERAGVAA